MRKLALSLLVLGSLAGCGTSPEPDYYVLTPTPGAPREISTQLKIERPVLPEYLDRPQIVQLKSNDQVSIDEMQRWAAPLDIMIEGVLAEDLRQRMPPSLVTTEQEGEARDARFVIQSTLKTFNNANDNNSLRANVKIDDRKGCKSPSLFSITFAATTSGDREEGLSQLIGEMSDFIIENLETKSLNQSCPHS